ncbi:translocon-associated protein subunit alpha [Cryptomeria japonica]|uniref:translocon-associated protein subunit alpha n=1 Tax=Cryptomeria japonica TaxID=3369 RepID=UPI0027DA94C8|nr:translocon-associated protein subunit alpha [Cryptomeria japonica]
MATHRLFMFILISLLFVGIWQVASSSEAEGTDVTDDGGELGIVGDGVQDFGDPVLGTAPGVVTVCFFPKSSDKSIPAGEETELLVGVNNDGEAVLKVHSIKASIHWPFDHKLFVQNLTVKEFQNDTVPQSAQATFLYSFVVSKFLQPGSFDLVGSISYEVDEQLFQTVFYNGTIEVVEASGIISIETVFLITLGISFIGLLGVWVQGQIQRISQKTKKTSKVEVGTGNSDIANEWLKGTAFTQKPTSNLSASHRSKKKK